MKAWTMSDGRSDAASGGRLMTRLRRALPAIWQTRGPAARLLVPLSWLYRGVVRARRRCYARGSCRVQRFSKPVVVVGGITVGGSGKTPLVMHIAQLLVKRGCRPGIVSRGYGGHPPRRPLRVDAVTPPAACGDEPAMMARRLQVPIVVDVDRPRGINALIAESGCDIVISDDGLQHYAMDRQVEIAVVGGTRMGNGWCLPAGPLREPQSRMEAVDLVVYKGSVPSAGGYAMALRIETLQRLNGGEQRPVEAFQGQRVHGVAGTGDPAGFFAALTACGLAVAPHPFPDHHAYQPEDFTALRDAPIVMTEKDAVKCLDIPLDDAWCARARVDLNEGFDNKLIELLNL